MCWSGSRASRRAMVSQYRASKSSSGTRCSSPRLTPCTNAASSSASNRGEGTPASASRWVAWATSASSRFIAVLRTGSRAGRGGGAHGLRGGELRGGVGVDTGLDDGVEVTVEHLVQVVRLEADAVVRDPVFREVVRADLLGAVHGAHLAAAHVGRLLLGCLLGRGQQPGPQDAHGLLLVLELALLVLAGRDDAGRQVRDAHGGVRGVDGLAAGTRGAVDVDAQVVGVDLDVDLFRLGRDEHTGGGGVDAALRLGGGHALHTALVLHPGPDALAGLGGAVAALGLHGDLDVLVAAELGLGGVDDLGLPADALGVAQVHAQQVAREQGGLVAAGARLDLQEHVLVVAGVTRDQEKAELLGDLLALLLQDLDLGGEVRVVGRELAGGPDVVAGLLPGPVGGDDRGELRVALVELARVGLVGVDRRVGELLLEIGVLADQFLDRLEHLRAPGFCVIRLRACWRCAVGARSRGARPHSRKNAGPGARVRASGTGAVARYLLAEPVALPKRASKRATRPPVSRIFCLPVQNGWHSEQTSARMAPPSRVLRVVNDAPQVQLTCVSTYWG